MPRKSTFTASRDWRTKRWTGIAWLPATDGTKRQIDYAHTPDSFATKREALAAIKERV